MKKLLLAAAFVGMSAAPTLAADIAARPYTKAPPIVQSYDWTGLYIGANAGYGWATNDHTANNANFWSPLGGVQRTDFNGAVYGGQIGYNWQFANWVLGIEGQYNGADLKRTDTSRFFPATDLLSAKVDSFATATARLGYAFNNWLPYVKGGYAGAQLKTGNFDIFGNHFNNSQWRDGFVVGAGLEYAFANNWTVGVEYNYMDLGNRSVTGTNFTAGGAPFGTVNFTDDLKLSTVTARLNYKFGPIFGR